MYTRVRVRIASLRSIKEFFYTRICNQAHKNPTSDMYMHLSILLLFPLGRKGLQRLESFRQGRMRMVVRRVPVHQKV